MVFASCNRNQQTYTTTTEYFLLSPTDVISAKAVMGTINNYWNGDYTFTGNDVNYTDVKAKTKYLGSVAAILLHGGELKEYMPAETDFITYNMYRKSDNALLVSTKFYVDSDGDFTSEELTDNVADE